MYSWEYHKLEEEMKNAMNEIKSIIFDMDGVIVDSEPLHYQAEQATCKQYGIEAPWAE